MYKIFKIVTDVLDIQKRERRLHRPVKAFALALLVFLFMAFIYIIFYEVKNCYVDLSLHECVSSSISKSFYGFSALLFWGFYFIFLVPIVGFIYIFPFVLIHIIAILIARIRKMDSIIFVTVL